MTPSADPSGLDETFYEGKADVYQHARNDVLLRRVLAALPPNGRVLDVGCGSGDLLARIGARAGYRAGVELSGTAATRASQVADQVANVPITAELPFPRQSFDVIVCADILEHLADPDGALRWVMHWCRPGGAVVISVPNVANWQARLRLLRGVWRYESCGLFDSGHLRFFTRETLLELVSGCELAVESCVPARLPGLALQVPAVMRLPTPVRQIVDRTARVVGYGLAQVWPTLFAYQLICTARRPPQPVGHVLQPQAGGTTPERSGRL